MKYYKINVLYEKQKKFALFLNDYEPYQEIRDLRNYDPSFKGFTNGPIIFNRSPDFENGEPLSDFLVSDWAQVIISQKVYDFLHENYADEIDFYPCYVEDYDETFNYYIVRASKELDVIDEKYSTISRNPEHTFVVKQVLDDKKINGSNFFAVKNGFSPVISETLYKQLCKQKFTCFSASRINTTSEMESYYDKNPKESKDNQK